MKLFVRIARLQRDDLSLFRESLEVLQLGETVRSLSRSSLWKSCNSKRQTQEIERDRTVSLNCKTSRESLEVVSLNCKTSRETISLNQENLWKSCNCERQSLSQLRDSGVCLCQLKDVLSHLRGSLSLSPMRDSGVCFSPSARLSLSIKRLSLSLSIERLCSLCLLIERLSLSIKRL